MKEVITPLILLEAYCQGIFPMARGRHNAEIEWYEPERRGVLPLEGMHVPARLRRAIRQQPYEITFDRDFARVIRACADARRDTWINDEIIRLYTELHRIGHAHSVEAWTRDGRLAGGLYGVSIGGAFFGESMFSTEDNASKIALVYLAARLWRRGFSLLDAQFVNEHLKQFGCREMPRAAYRSLLKKAIAEEAFFQSPVSGASGAAAAGAVSVFSGAAAGAVSDENSSAFADVEAFLHSISHTS